MDSARDISRVFITHLTYFCLFVYLFVCLFVFLEIQGFLCVALAGLDQAGLKLKRLTCLWD